MLASIDSGRVRVALVADGSPAPSAGRAASASGRSPSPNASRRRKSSSSGRVRPNPHCSRRSTAPARGRRRSFGRQLPSFPRARRTHERAGAEAPRAARVGRVRVVPQRPRQRRQRALPRHAGHGPQHARRRAPRELIAMRLQHIRRRSYDIAAKQAPGEATHRAAQGAKMPFGLGLHLKAKSGFEMSAFFGNPLKNGSWLLLGWGSAACARKHGHVRPQMSIWGFWALAGAVSPFFVSSAPAGRAAEGAVPAGGQGGVGGLALLGGGRPLCPVPLTVRGTVL